MDGVMLMCVLCSKAMSGVRRKASGEGGGCWSLCVCLCVMQQDHEWCEIKAGGVRDAGIDMCVCVCVLCSKTMSGVRLMQEGWGMLVLICVCVCYAARP